ncbi:hypothetical protein ACFL47_02025 [Candidatus Latescibacterota bacterium]
MNIPGWMISLDIFGFFTARVLLSVLWQSTILLTAIGLLALSVKRCGESFRFILLVGAVLVIPVLPVMSYFLMQSGMPSAEIRILPEYSDPQAKMAVAQLKMRLPEARHDGSEVHTISFGPSRVHSAPPTVDLLQKTSTTRPSFCH